MNPPKFPPNSGPMQMKQTLVGQCDNMQIKSFVSRVYSLSETLERLFADVYIVVPITAGLPAASQLKLVLWEACIAKGCRKTTPKAMGSVSTRRCGQVPYNMREKAIETGGCEVGT